MCPTCEKLQEENGTLNTTLDNAVATIVEIEATNDTLTSDNARLRQQVAELREQVLVYRETGNELTAILCDVKGIKNGGKRKALRVQ